ncbi:metal ABC transporter solute-binding protein, Zn/Mn family [Rhodococcus phenolicus]|uniref:metal ABC transporter solute-binding protein, Zn/Mn family n=1 Tax=Rhodococcus phenolicus TaxID=263849 RepID=UPI0008350B35|nr:zinc ABC transporter substrate-binding protein [Rhodococcus phenolicus]
MRLSPRTRAATAAVALAGVTALSLTACGSGSDSDSGGIKVVASTNVWGSVAQAVAGDRLEVRSLITEPSADPHSYEASPADAAALSDASLVVYNGGGYDQFVDDVLEATNTGAATVDAFALFESGENSDLHAGHDHGAEATDSGGAEATDSGEAEAHEDAHEEDAHDHSGGGHEGHDHGGVNEHVWYDLATADAVAHAVADRLAELDPEGADVYRANAAAFHTQLHEVSDRTAAVAAAHPQAPIAQTEPIGHYLVQAAALNDVTPTDFTNAVENGTDPSPASIAATRQLLLDKQVRVLIYNPQTEDKVSREMRNAAEQSGIPVVEVSETLPEDVDYVRWQTDTVEKLTAALGTPA